MLSHDTVSTNHKFIKKRNFRNTAFISCIFKLFALECNIAEHSLVSKTKYLINIFIIAIVHGILVSCSLFFKIRYSYSFINVSIKYTDAVQTVYDYCQYIVDLYFVYKYGRHIGLEYYKQYDNIDKILSVSSYSTMTRRFMKLTGFYTLIWLISSTCDFAAWVLNFGWAASLMYSIAYVYIFVKILTTLDFSSHVMRIEIRLRIIGDALKDCYTEMECCTQFVGDLICNQNWLYRDPASRIIMAQTHLKCLKVSSNNDIITMQWLTRCYFMITEQVVFINTMYGTRILLNSLSLLIDMVRFTNIAVRIIAGSQHTSYNSGYFPAISSLMRLLTCVALIISLVIQCEQAYSQRERILNHIDHMLIIKNPSKELTLALTEFRTLVQNRPIVFNVANFFQLKNSLLLSIASVVVTYTIILVQSIN